MRFLAATIVLALAPLGAQQPIDAGYTAKIKEYTTEPFFLTELVDHLPASATVPTPEKVLGYISGSPNRLTYTRDVHRYMRELEKASPRVQVFASGKSEEGREFLLVAISDEANIRRLDHYKSLTNRLSDPRKITPAEAARVIEEALPMYWATGAIHSPETGSPEMLMELAYRLAVQETPFIETIRKNSIVLITPVVEVDGRDRQVDLYHWRKANPGRTAPNLLYWGKYVAHDNNRDGMALTLELSRFVVRTFLDWRPQVLHDLHESVPFLYTSTGTGPYNAWLDPIVINEWHRLAYHEIEEMTKRGVPGVWTHGFYDGWAANYMFTAAHGHNAIGRFYETFGGRGADTMERTVPAGQTTRTWFRPNPPLPRVRWSQRNNTNLMQSALLLAMNYFAANKKLFLDNFYQKSRRSVEKAVKEGPAAWVMPADDPRPLEAADLVNLLGQHGVEIHRLAAPIEKPQKFGAGSYVIRMDQPYSRMADMLLDKQYYSVNDPRPYDDTGWSHGPLRNVTTVRVVDKSILEAPMAPVTTPVRITGAVEGPQRAAAYLIPHNAENALATLRFRLKGIKVHAARDAFGVDGRTFAAGSFIVKQDGNPGDLRARLERAAADLGVKVAAVDSAPNPPMHELAEPRVALVHTWTNTQNEGWFRYTFDRQQIPYTYISDHTLRKTPNLRERFDVIVFGPVNGTSQRIVNGTPTRGQPIPWNASIGPNVAMSPDLTDDTRGGMGLEGLLNLQRFIDDGGLFVTITGNASIPIDYGLIEGVTIAPARELQARGSVLLASVADKGSPIAYGYPDKFAVQFSNGPIFRVSATGGLQFGGGGGAQQGAPAGRTSGRGSPMDPDVPQGRPLFVAPPRPQAPGGDEIPEDLREQVRGLLPSAEERPRVVVRFAGESELLVSGMLAGGRELAGQPAVVDVPRGKGHVLLFAGNPMWRHQTQGSHMLLLNAIMHYNHLGVGRPAARRESSEGEE
jgi:hypothetical protein